MTPFGGESNLCAGRRTLRLAFCIAAGMAASACAVDNTGFLASKITDADGALVADVYSLGLQVRTISADQGVTLGYQRRSYVFELDESSPLEPGWYFGHVPVPPDAFVAMNARTYGIEFDASAPEVGISLGLRDTTLLGRIEQNHDGVILLSYEPENPEKTKLSTCREVSQCAVLD